MSVRERSSKTHNITFLIYFLIPDYRARVLSRFGDRLQEIYLDNEKGNQTEYDTALVLSALRISAQASQRKLHSLLLPDEEEQQQAVAGTSNGTR